jgi:hypothetical protein
MLKWDRRKTKSMLSSITRSDGTRYSSVEEFRNALLDEIARGHEVLPMSDECEGFDFKTGCPGHEQPEPSP